MAFGFRSGLYYEVVIDDLEKTLDFHRKVGTRIIDYIIYEVAREPAGSPILQYT